MINITHNLTDPETAYPYVHKLIDNASAMTRRYRMLLLRCKNNSARETVYCEVDRLVYSIEECSAALAADSYLHLYEPLWLKKTQERLRQAAHNLEKLAYSNVMPALTLTPELMA